MIRLKWRVVWLMVLVGFVFPGQGLSNEAVPAGYRSIASESGIPHTLLYAVALTESGKQVGSIQIYRPWPWTLNVAGQGYFFESRQAAWQALMAHLKDGKRSIDIGLMQVNWRYHQEKLGTPWHALDPYFNLRVGAGILQACYNTRQDWWASVGCYHSPTNPQRAEQYRRRVISRWQRIASTR